KKVVFINSKLRKSAQNIVVEGTKTGKKSLENIPPN
ncbi:SAM-dependent methyltransferase, partial [Staphylococcus aureus]|nr:SAM-dependent methyltransferase [Staphylococcus aureus]